MELKLLWMEINLKDNTGKANLMGMANIHGNVDYNLKELSKIAAGKEKDDWLNNKYFKYKAISQMKSQPGCVVSNSQMEMYLMVNLFLDKSMDLVPWFMLE